jgi:hypothetical protein
MILQIKAKVKIDTLNSFAQSIMFGKLDRSAILGETYCEKNDPVVGISYWQVDDMKEFEEKFSSWKQFYETFEVKEVLTAKNAFFSILKQK